MTCICDMYIVYCIRDIWHAGAEFDGWVFCSSWSPLTSAHWLLHHTVYFTIFSKPYTAYYILYTAHCIYIVHFSPHTAHTGPRWHLQHFSSSIPSRAPHSAFDGSDDGGLIALIAPTCDWHRDAILNIESPHIITLTWNAQFFEEEESSCGRRHLRIPPFLGRGGKSREIQRKSAGTNSLIFSTDDCSLRGVWSRSA